MIMPVQERIDAFERTLLWVAHTSELQSFAARIIEEGTRPEDFLQWLGPSRTTTLFTAILIRAMRPPFRLPDSMGFGQAALWDISMVGS